MINDGSDGLCMEVMDSRLLLRADEWCWSDGMGDGDGMIKDGDRGDER